MDAGVLSLDQSCRCQGQGRPIPMYPVVDVKPKTLSLPFIVHLR